MHQPAPSTVPSSPTVNTERTKKVTTIPVSLQGHDTASAHSGIQVQPQVQLLDWEHQMLSPQ